MGMTDGMGRMGRKGALWVATGVWTAAILTAAFLTAVVWTAVAPPLALAHSPRFHQAKLVLFEPPIPAPGFTLKDPDGRSVSLADFRGKFVLLNYWATWCPPCVQEMPSLQGLAKRFKGRPLVVLGISLDAEGAAKVKPFLKKLGITFPIALDPASRVSAAYGARELPATFLIDPQGRVVMAAKGARDWNSRQIAGYLEEVIATSSSRK